MKVEEALPKDYTPYCDRKPAEAHCKKLKELEERRNKRSITSNAAKAIPAIHLTNLTSIIPVFGEEVHILAKRSIVYDPRNAKTISTLTYGSPWAVMESYDPRSTILQVRSLIPAVESGGKY